MPINTTCPECDKNYTLADTMQGKSVKCKGCGNPFTVKAASGSTAVAAKPSNGKPKAAATATKTGKPAVKRDDDDEESVQAPPKKKGGLGIWLLFGGGLVAAMMLLVCGGGSIGAYFLFFRGNAVTKANFDKIKGGMSPAQVQEILGKPDKTEDPKDLAAFGLKATGLPKTSIWESGKNSITVTYSEDKVIAWVGKFDGAEYAMADTSSLFAGLNPPKSTPDTNPNPKVNPDPDPKPKVNPDSNPDPKPNPNPTPKPTSPITLDNFNKIKGGMNPAELVALLGLTTQLNRKPDALAAQVVSDRGSSTTWVNGSDSITVSFTPDFKAAYWTATIGGQTQTKSEPTLAVKPSPNTNLITKANYDQIRGGMTEDQLTNLLGKITNANTNALDQETIKFDKTRVNTWVNGSNYISVTLCDGKAAHWAGAIDGRPLDSKTDPAFVVLKGANPNPNPNAESKLTRAAYNTIVEGQTTLAAVAQSWGPPMPNGTNGKNPAKDAGFRQKWIWVDGNTSVDVEATIQGVITHKGERNLK